MPKVTLSIPELFRQFPDDAVAERWWTRQRWPDGPVCPRCKSTNIQCGAKHPSQPYRCRTCEKRFSARTGSIMERSKLGYQTWAIAIYILTHYPKGVSSLQLAKVLGISRKTAWFLGHRIRESFDDAPAEMKGPVEIDETYIGGKEKNKHWKKKLRAGRGPVGKIPIVGIRERTSRRVHAEVVDSTKKKVLQDFIHRTVRARSMIYSDDHGSYGNLCDRYDHGIIRHSRSEYVRGDCHTNGIESLWATFKRQYMGTHHVMSRKHLQRYVNECCGRLNLRGLDSLSMMGEVVRGMNGKRLTFRDLVG